MTLLPEVRQALYETAARRSTDGRRAGPPGWVRAGARTVPVAVAAAVSLAVLVVALVTLKPSPHHGSPPRPSVSGGAPPPIPGLPPAGAVGYIERAQRTVDNQDRACVGAGPGPGSLSTGSPSRATLAAFSVLSRPATRDDRRMIDIYEHRGPGGLDGPGVYVNYIRQAQYRYGGGYFLVPLAHVAERTPVRCDREEMTALRLVVARASRGVRATVLRWKAASLAWHRYDQEHPEGICLEHLGDKGFGGGGCGETAYDIEQGFGGGLTSAEGARGGGFIAAGIIPDGVATVSVHYPAHRRAHGRRPTRAFSATVPVVNNVVVVKLPPGVGLLRRAVVWRAADGAVIPHA